MRCITTYFDWPGNNVFKALHALMRRSFQNNRVPLESIKMEVPAKSNRPQFDSNHEKLILWGDILNSTNEDIIFLDTDMFLLRDIRLGMKNVKHIGITYRDAGYWPPINGGVVFIRNTPESRQLIKDWVAADKELYANPTEHMRWKQKYAGINQSSLGYIIETTNAKKYITKLKCRDYNCVEPWTHWKQSAIIHIKGRLRQAWMGYPVQGLSLQTRQLVRKLRAETKAMGILPSPDLKVKKYSGEVGVKKSPKIEPAPQRVH
jgi:hypothetical protein